MHIILTAKNNKAIEQAVTDLEDEYGSFDACQRVASVDGGLIVYILYAPDAFLYQEDIQRIASSVVNVSVVGD